MSKLIQLRSDMLEARRKNESQIVSILSTVIGEVESKATVVDGVKTVDDQTVMDTVQKFIKNIEEVLRHRPDDTKSAWEKEFLTKYLPAKLSDEILTELVWPGATLAEYMAFLKVHYRGMYDGKRATEVYKSIYG